MAGADGGADLTVWEFWWGFNKDPYLNLKAKIHDLGVMTGSDDFFLGHGQKNQAKDSLRPSEETIRGKVVPALIKALETERSNDIVTGAMIALAKIGDARDESGESKFEKIIAKFLSDSNQEIAETAALALGILANDASVPTLVSLMKDMPEARKLVGATEVPYRTRAFAAYGLGLIGAATSDNALRQDIAEHLVDILDSPAFATRDIKVAAMIALGLTPIEPLETAAELSEEELASNRRHVLSRQTQLAFLLDYFKEDRATKDSRHWFVRAHAPTSMARLLAGDAATGFKAQVTAVLLDAVGTHSKERQEVQQTCALALGQIGDNDGDEIDTKIRTELDRVAREGDQQSRRFALIALAQTAGNKGDNSETAGKGIEEVRSSLLKQMSRGKTQMKPWAALSIGVMGRALQDNSMAEQMSPAVGQALRAATADCKRPDEIGAYCVALGLRNDLEATEIILRKMDDFQGSDLARGYAAVALGLMNQRTAIQPIQDVVRKSKYRPELLKQAAIALGLLGDKELVDDLITMLGEAKGLATQAAISTALGAIGDSRSIDPLVEMLDNKQITDTARGFSAVALGIVCDKEPLPWVSKIATNINYRANTVTLTGETGTGILDIL